MQVLHFAEGAREELAQLLLGKCFSPAAGPNSSRGGGEEKLGRDEISPVPALCSCLDAAEHLQPQLSTCCLCSIMTAAAQPRLPCPAALSALHAQGQDLGLWPGEMQQSSSEAVLGMLPAHKRL